MKLATQLFIFIISPIFIFSQTPEIEIQKRYMGNSIAAFTTEESDFIVSKIKEGYEGIEVIKLDGEFQPVWEYLFTDNQNYFGLQKMIHTNDGGYLVLGSVDGFSNDLVFKLNSNGTLEWSHIYHFEADYGISARSIVAGSDGGFVICGNGKGIIKLDNDGNIEFFNEIFPDTETVSIISETNDGGYVLGSTKSVTGSFDLGVFKLNESGDIEWQRTFGGSREETFNSGNIMQTDDNGFVFVATTNSEDGDVSGWNNGTDILGYTTDIWAVKIDPNGDIQWENAIGGSNRESGGWIAKTNDGYIILGLASSNDGDVNGWHEGYASSGEAIPDIWAVKLDNSGNIVWNQAYGGSGRELLNINTAANEIHPLMNGGYFFSGYSVSDDGDLENVENAGNWIVKLTPEIMGVADIESNTVRLYPNPTSDILNLEGSQKIRQVHIYNQSGQEVKKLKHNSEKLIINTEELPIGIYFIKVFFESGTKVFRIIKK